MADLKDFFGWLWRYLFEIGLAGFGAWKFWTWALWQTDAPIVIGWEWLRWTLAVAFTVHTVFIIFRATLVTHEHDARATTEER